MKYFIYSHSLDDIIFYIGYSAMRPPQKGYHSHGIKYQRAYILSQRHSAWKIYVNGRENEVAINIIQYVEDKITAFRKEAELIQLHINTVINVASAEPVYQFDLDGNFIKKHLYLEDAAKSTKIDRATINHVLLGNRRSAGGFLWSKIQTVFVVFEKRIIKKDFSGNIVARYKTFLEAAASINTISTNAIRNCLIGKQKQAYGYLWSIENEPVMAKELGLSVNRLAKL